VPLVNQWSLKGLSHTLQGLHLSKGNWRANLCREVLETCSWCCRPNLQYTYCFTSDVNVSISYCSNFCWNFIELRLVGL